MAGYVELGGVRTWYDDQGEGDPLVLLHPGMVDARALAPNVRALATRFQVFTPERRGHGRTPDVDGPIGYELMARDLPVFAAKMARMHMEEPTLSASELSGIRSRTLVMVGDDDEPSLEHTVALYRGIPNAELAVVPGTSHGLLVEKPALCNTIIVDFLTTEPVPTLAPIHRA